MVSQETNCGFADANMEVGVRWLRIEGAPRCQEWVHLTLSWAGLLRTRKGLGIHRCHGDMGTGFGARVGLGSGTTHVGMCPDSQARADTNLPCHLPPAVISDTFGLSKNSHQHRGTDLTCLQRASLFFLFLFLGFRVGFALFQKEKRDIQVCRKQSSGRPRNTEKTESSQPLPGHPPTHTPLIQIMSR